MSTSGINGASSTPGFISLAIERQQTAALAAIKSQATAEQAVADLVAQAVQQAPQPDSGTPSPSQSRGARVNILV